MKWEGELLPNTRVCTLYGAVSALLAQAVPVAPTKRKRWFWVIAVPLVIVAVTVIRQKTMELARYLTGESRFLDLVGPPPELKRSDDLELRKRVLDLSR